MTHWSQDRRQRAKSDAWHYIRTGNGDLYVAELPSANGGRLIRAYIPLINGEGGSGTVTG